MKKIYNEKAQSICNNLKNKDKIKQHIEQRVNSLSNQDIVKLANSEGTSISYNYSPYDIGEKESYLIIAAAEYLSEQRQDADFELILCNLVYGLQGFDEESIVAITGELSDVYGVEL